jgi:hypothetical protein
MGIARRSVSVNSRSAHFNVTGPSATAETVINSRFAVFEISGETRNVDS